MTIQPLPLDGLSRLQLQLLLDLRASQRRSAQRLAYAARKDESRIRRALAKTP